LDHLKGLIQVSFFIRTLSPNVVFRFCAVLCRVMKINGLGLDLRMKFRPPSYQKTHNAEKNSTHYET
jgi:hypothetical protein